MLACFIGSCVAALMVAGGTGGPVTLNGRQIGVYDDDSTPNKCAVVAQQRAANPAELILASKWIGYKSKCAGATNVLEWYPFKFAPWEKVNALPCGWDGYIVQYRFDSPTFKQRLSLLREIRECHKHPQYIIRY